MVSLGFRPKDDESKDELIRALQAKDDQIMMLKAQITSLQARLDEKTTH